MGSNRISACLARRVVLSSFACLCAGAILITAAMAIAQEGVNPPPSAESPGFFASIGRWFEQQAANFKSNIKDAASKVENFGQDAGSVAKTTVDTAKDAAGAVIRIPATRVVSGHEPCALAPNDAPDCVAAANAMCTAKGFAFGKSVDMTTAEVCKAEVYLSGRTSGPGCRTETFVSRAICQ
jgi:hypothetical protein